MTSNALSYGFNGAATARSRNSDCSDLPSRPQNGFNGAATARSRNLAVAMVLLYRLVELQWGRDRAVAELWLQGAGGVHAGGVHAERLQWGRDRAVAELRAR